MAISDSLFKAILSMDAYNRGYNPGLTGIKGGIGSATFLRESDVEPGTLGVSVGFYAIAYQMADGSKIISYRGTDDAGTLSRMFLDGDVLNGWTVGGGDFYSKQAMLAYLFYQSVAGSGVDLTKANIALTGHSLGGGLAGLVAESYNKSAVIFDNMPFELAAINTYNYSNKFKDSALKTIVYGASAPWPYTPTPSHYIHTYATSGELLMPLRNAQAAASTTLDLFTTIGLPDLVDRHSSSLLVVRMYAEEAGVGLNWKGAARYLWPALFDNTIAQAAHAEWLSGKMNSNSDYAGTMRTAIAYSAIDSGATVFGDAGIRVMYDDANDLGSALSLAAPLSVLKSNGAALANTLVQYAGQVALAKAMRAGHAEALNGVLNLDGAKSQLAIDFSKKIWTLNGAIAQTSIVGRQALTEAILSSEDPRRTSAKGLGAAAFAESIGKIVLATTNVALTTTVPVATDAGKALMFVAGGGNDKLTGSTISDLIYGGLGDDTFYASAGNDALTGGGGKDSADYSALSSGITVRAGATALTYTIIKSSGTGAVSAEKQLAGSRYSGGLAANMNDPTTAICKEVA